VNADEETAVATKSNSTLVPARKAAPAKQAAIAKKPIPAKKVAAAKKVAPVKRVAPAKKSAPARKAAPTKKAVPTKKAAPAGRPAAKKAPARAPKPLGYDPRAQLEKLSEVGPVAARRGRGLEPAPASVDVDAVLGAFFGLRTDEPLTPERFAAAAQELGVEAAALRAIAQVESAGSGFDSKGRPTILFERHVFARNTAPKGRFNAQHPDISAGVPYAKGTFGNIEQQWIKLARAYQLDPEAALKAPSWGTFQILGENHRASGFADVRSFVGAMFRSPAGHLRALVGFIQANPSIHQGLKRHDWVAVAKGYNGAGYKTYAYDTKLAAAYAKFAVG
jgi:N-acetylmuramidase